MIKKETLEFLTDLKNNNVKEWFEENRNRYELAKTDILSLTGKLIIEIAGFDRTIANANLKDTSCITRINRDLRFSKDKTPYKSDYYIVLNKFGRSSPAAFYYLHIEPDNCFIGGGIWNPEPEELKRCRQEIDFAFKEWSGIINDPTFLKYFPGGLQGIGVLTKIPKGYTEKNPAIEFLKMKGFCTKESISDKEVMAADSLEKVITYFKAVKPMVDFLNRAIEND